MQSAARKQSLAVQNIGIREIDCEQRVVFANGRAEQHRPLAPKLQSQLGEKSRAAVKDPLLAQAHGLYVAVAVENRKRVAAFQYSRPIVGKGRLRQNIILIAN